MIGMGPPKPAGDREPDLALLLRQGEGPRLEFKRSTGELREAMQTLCAFIHRDYSIAGGAVSLAVFDDRVEVWSAGTYPSGITSEMLSGSHQSVQRNPIIADVFFRAGLIEKWGRGTNRVIAMCREAGIKPPSFQEVSGAALVTFRVKVAEPAPQVTPQVTRLLEAAARGARLRKELQETVGVRDREHFRKAYIEVLLAAGWLARTIPGKPRSRFQKYLTTDKGLAEIKEGKISPAPAEPRRRPAAPRSRPRTPRPPARSGRPHPRAQAGPRTP